MGGLGSGGGRVGTGPKEKSADARFLHGTRGAQAPAAVKPFAVLPPRADLSEAARSIWLELAEFGAQQRTLTQATSRAFADLCEAIVKRDAMWAQIEAGGFTHLKITVDGSGQEHSELKAHPLLARHTALMQRVEAGMARFRLAPVGKEFVAPVEEVDQFAEFEGDPH